MSALRRKLALHSFGRFRTAAFREERGKQPGETLIAGASLAACSFLTYVLQLISC